MQKKISRNHVLKTLIYFESVDSTNKFLSDNDFASGTVVMAGRQSAGKGKHGAAWESPRGGLWFSYSINMKIKKPYDYVVLSSVAAAETLKKYGIYPEIKWPNDILASGKKLAGILLENDYYSGKLITGMGINVNNEPPAGVNAVSVKQFVKTRIDTMLLAMEIIKKIDNYIYNLRQKRRVLYVKWTNFQKNLEGSEIKFLRRGKTGKVTVLKVASGRIKVRDKKGRIFSVPGEVFFK